MYEAINTKQVVGLTKHFTDTAFKAHSIAIAGLERAMELQLKAFETRFNAATDYFSEAVEVRDAEGARALMPKAVNLAKDATESLYHTSQELVGLSVKTTEAIGELLKGSLEYANDVAAKPAAAPKKAAAK
jgi:hypothetical protein